MTALLGDARAMAIVAGCDRVCPQEGNPWDLAAAAAGYEPSIVRASMAISPPAPQTLIDWITAIDPLHQADVGLKRVLADAYERNGQIDKAEQARKQLAALERERAKNNRRRHSRVSYR